VIDKSLSCSIAAFRGILKADFRRGRARLRYISHGHARNDKKVAGERT
jgi:hypothetical protein